MIVKCVEFWFDVFDYANDGQVDSKTMKGKIDRYNSLYKKLSLVEQQEVHYGVYERLDRLPSE